MPSTPAILGAVAAVFAVIALSLKAYAISLYEFVDVHAVERISDASADNRVGGVGVFRSEFNTIDTPDQEAVAAARLPQLDIETPSTSFPLLFPAQENFIATQLPLTSQSIVAFEAGFQDAVDANTNLGPIIAQLESLELDECSDYVEDTRDLLTDYIAFFVNDTIPQAGAFLLNAIADAELVTGALRATEQHYGEIFVNGTIGFFQGVALEVAQNPNLDCDFDILVFPDACFVALLDAAVANAPPGDAFLALVTDISNQAPQACEGETLLECITVSLNFQPERTTAANDPVAFGIDSEFVCDGGFCDSDTTHIQFLQKLAGLYETLIASSDDAAVIANLQALSQAVNALLLGGAFNIPPDTLAATLQTDIVDANLKFADDAPWASETLIPEACAKLDAVSRLLVLATQTQGFELGETCNFNTFLNEEFLGGILIQLGQAATGAQVIALSALLSNALDTDFAKFLLPNVFINRGFGGLVPDEAVLAVTPINSFATAECDDDVVDKEYIGHGQRLVISAAFFQASVVLLVLAGTIGFARGLTFTVAAVLAIISGLCTIGALLIVSAAPVYEGVGVEPDGVDATFVRGSVATIALAEAIIMIVSGILLIVGACFHSKSKNASVNYNENVEAKEVKVASPQNDGGDEGNMEDKL